MSRPTRLIIDSGALLYNLAQIKKIAPEKKIITMVKANAYGCGLQVIVPILDGYVDAFGVACIEEALVIRRLGSRSDCILFQGVFSPDEFKTAAEHSLGCVLHQEHQLEWLLATQLDKPIKLWVKVDTGMHRLGFKLEKLQDIMDALQTCPWVDKNIGLMTHLACADEMDRIETLNQIALFEQITVKGFAQRSIANSAAIIAFPQTHLDVVRPGIMLYGVSPFTDQNAVDLGLRPVMHFVSAISAINDIPQHAQVGYGGIWTSTKPSRIGVVAVGYGDGYPRHIDADTQVWIQGREITIVGRVSMDMLTVDLTDHPDIMPGALVELWGKHIFIERIARSAKTSSYELMCQISQRVRHL